MSMTIGLPATRATLPYVLTPVLGRECETANLRALLSDADHRLVTILGPGGVGKTRLAIHVASGLADQGRDVLFVTVAAMRDPALVLQAIGHAAGASGEAPEKALPWLVEAAQDRDLLLVLDNLEQVLEVAPDLSRLLEECPLLTILATSRAALEVDGEERFELAPLDLPDSSASTDEILDSDAVTLFMIRARAANPNVSLGDHAPTLGAICHRLDGLPLAIELAAARTTILPPAALLARLDGQLQVLGGMRQDVPDRQRTMRETIAWSYELLASPEQALFRHLGMFAGGFSADAVAHVGEALGIADVGQVVHVLVGQSLLREGAGPGGEPRYQMLETVRSYALEQLRQQGDEHEARLTHAEFTARMCETAEPNLLGPEQGAWMKRLDLELGNIRSVVNWALDVDASHFVLRIGGSLSRYLIARGHISESRAWLKQALDVPGDYQAPWRPAALVVGGTLAERQNDNDEAMVLLEQARHLSVALGDKKQERRALMTLAGIAQDRAEFDLANQQYMEALELAREIQDTLGIAVTLGNLGTMRYHQGNLEGAADTWKEAYDLIIEVGDKSMESLAASNLGAIISDLGDSDAASQYLARALKLQREMGDLRTLPGTLLNIADVAGDLKDYSRAQEAYAEALDISRKTGHRVIEAHATLGMAAIALAMGDEAGSAASLLDAIRLCSGTEIVSGVLLIGHFAAKLCAHRGDYETAVELVAGAAALRSRADTQPTPEVIREVEDLTKSAGAALTGDTYASHWSAGGALDYSGFCRKIEVTARDIVGTQQPTPTTGMAEQAGQDGKHSLTARELEVLRILAKGATTDEISGELDVRPRTVATHVANILAKLEVPSRTAAVAWALRSGIE